MPSPTRIAVIGSGPAGFYAAGHLLADSGGVIEVDMIERLPVPFGLVRYGVAPDHPRLKQPTLVFDKIAQSPGFTFLGNVTVGRDLSLEQLQATITRCCSPAARNRTGASDSRMKTCPAVTLPRNSSAGTTGIQTTASAHST